MNAQKPHACATKLSEIQKESALKGELQLFPDGEFAPRDGRLGPDGRWLMNAAIAAKLMADAAERQTPYVIDYEHQTQAAEYNGLPAPAAGFFSQLEYRQGLGLFAVGIDWTDKARAMIESGEYRYCSPVFYDFSTDTPDVYGIHTLICAALTNLPALDGMAQAARTKPETKMSLQATTINALLAAFGLPDTATDADVTAAIAKAGEGWNGSAPVTTRLQTARATIADLEARVANPDPAKFVPVETMTKMQQQIATLQQAADARAKADHEATVEQALTEGRIVPAQKPWALSLSPESLSEFLKTTTPTAGQQRQSQQAKANDDKPVLTDAMRALGITEEQLTKHAGVLNHA